MEILTSRQMREIDRRAEKAYGVPEIVLMENAGLQIFAFLRSVFDDLQARPLLLLCGKGNNGGDGFVLARHLHNRRVPFQALLFGRAAEVRGSALVNLKALRRLGVAPREITSRKDWRGARGLLGRSDIIVDAILGTGLSRPVGGLLATVFKDVNTARRTVLAVDIPSGLSGDTAELPGPCISADYTVTFVRPKIPHLFPPAESRCGELHVVEISVPDDAVARQGVELEVLQASDLLPFLPARKADSHKGTYGHALVVAGSRGKGGAARLVALAALRAGCGLVTAAVPRGIQTGMVPGAMEAMTEGLPETADGTIASSALPRLLAVLRGKQAVGIGPGLTTHPETKKLIVELVRRVRVPLVLDADGLNAFAGRMHLLSGRARPLVLTPHPGEMSRLAGISTDQVQTERIPLAREFARRHRCFLVLKGYRSLIATPKGRVYVNPTGNPGMATGGSGDLLTGILTGLLAQGLDVEGAVKAGVFLHGLAGDIAADEVGQMPLIARDVLARFPSAVARLKPAREARGRLRATS